MLAVQQCSRASRAVISVSEPALSPSHVSCSGASRALCFLSPAPNKNQLRRGAVVVASGASVHGNRMDPLMRVRARQGQENVGASPPINGDLRRGYCRPGVGASARRAEARGQRQRAWPGPAVPLPLPLPLPRSGRPAVSFCRARLRVSGSRAPVRLIAAAGCHSDE